MPVGSAVILARVFTAIQNMYAGESAATEPVETTGQIKKSTSQNQIRTASGEGRIGGPSRPVQRHALGQTNAERAEANRLQRERNRRNREAKHGPGNG